MHLRWSQFFARHVTYFCRFRKLTIAHGTSSAPLEHADVVSAAKFSSAGKRILTASFDKTLHIWDATPGLGRALPEKIPHHACNRTSQLFP